MASPALFSIPKDRVLDSLRPLYYEFRAVFARNQKNSFRYDDKIEIYFNSPIQPRDENGSPDESQGFVFYSEDIRLLLKDPHRSEPIRIEAQIKMRI